MSSWRHYAPLRPTCQHFAPLRAPWTHIGVKMRSRSTPRADVSAAQRSVDRGRADRRTAGARFRDAGTAGTGPNGWVSHRERSAFALRRGGPESEGSETLRPQLRVVHATDSCRPRVRGLRSGRGGSRPPVVRSPDQRAQRHHPRRHRPPTPLDRAGVGRGSRPARWPGRRSPLPRSRASPQRTDKSTP